MKLPSACHNVTDIRAAVNAIDRDLVRLLVRRQKYALAIRAIAARCSRNASHGRRAPT